ncbi:MAG: aromatic acid exporter family protein [Rhodospirillales bacterium]|nr:aromatic acid exporter family protein [Rhodospirillales bacterium]
MSARRLVRTIAARWGENWRDAMASAVAAGLAWLLAEHLFGHPKPLFAAISAIVCLSPGLPSHFRQALGLLVGVAIGIVVGEFGLLIPDTMPLLRLAFVSFVAIIVAGFLGLPPVVPIQAGVSAILVLALGPATAGSVRMLDVAVGAALGLFFSQILLTPNPVRIIDDAARNLLNALARGLSEGAEAVRHQDRRRAEAAVHRLSRAHDSLVALGAGINAARSAARWSLRGLLAAREVGEIAECYDRHSIRVYASTLLFGEALADAVRKRDGPPPPGLEERLRRVAASCIELAGGEPAPAKLAAAAPSPPSSMLASAPWQASLDRLVLVEKALSRFGCSDRLVAGPEPAATAASAQPDMSEATPRQPQADAVQQDREEETEEVRGHAHS